MCNPPFYASNADLLTSAAEKSRPPNSACTGAEVEMVTPGGEVAFVFRMIEESLTLKERVQWYSSMLGKLSSVNTVTEGLKEKGVDNWAVKEFVQGGKTRRWGVAWSWGDLRPSMDVARGIRHLPKNLLPFPSEYTFSISGTPPEAVATRLNETITSLDIRWQYRPLITTGIGFAKANVWSRAARRNKHKSAVAKPRGQDEEPLDEDEGEEEPALGIKITLRLSSNNSDVELLVRWLKGHDSVLFESFCGMLKRQITSE